MTSDPFNVFRFYAFDSLLPSTKIFSESYLKYIVLFLIKGNISDIIPKSMDFKKVYL